MKNRTISHLLVLLSASFIFHPVFTQIEPSSQQIPGVTLERTEVRTLHSNIIGQDFECWISVPRDYNVNDTVYPVIFLLDPYRTFSMMKGYIDVLTVPFSVIPEKLHYFWIS